MSKLVLSEFQKQKRSKVVYISLVLVIAYLTMILIYTNEATGLFDSFVYLYKFSLSYMNYLILPMILLSFLTTSFSNDYNNDTIKYIWTIPISRTKYFISKLVYLFMISLAIMIFVFLTVCITGFLTRFHDSMTSELVSRFFLLCIRSSIFIFLSVIPVSIITIVTKGNAATTNLIGSLYIVVTFFLMKKLQGISPLASSHNVIWYNTFEGVESSPHIGYFIANIVIVFAIYVYISIKILKKQDV
ncbi:MAG: ABC transporter permease [Anaerococcus sp.]|nr:ABC transporter permease [Anaerococcus sp.]MDU1829061.1 ABC transporter permease [Anaerococcus sp.]